MGIYWERVNQDTEIAKLVYHSLYKGRVRDSSELQSWRTIYYVSACIAMTPYYIKNMQYIETRVYRFIYCVSMYGTTHVLAFSCARFIVANFVPVRFEEVKFKNAYRTYLYRPFHQLVAGLRILSTSGR